MSLSKLLLCPCRLRPLSQLNLPAPSLSRAKLDSSHQLVVPQRVVPQLVPCRHGHYIPPTQYDMPFPKKFQLSHAMSIYWELIPIVTICAVAMAFMTFHILWATQNKVDVVFSSNSRNNISRTMNLRKPTVHKLVIINQRYEPWPEMQDVLDKMTAAERKLFNSQCLTK